MNKTSLLILDDEPEVLNALKRILRTQFELFLFSEPVKALEFYRENPVPLVLSDMRMPVMDGATFLTLISKINPRSRRFLLTGHSDIDLTVAAVNDGKISHYFAKPWDNKDLISQLQAAEKSYQDEIKSLRLLKVNHIKNVELSQQNASMVADVNKQQRQLLRLKKNFNVFIEIYADSIAMHTQDRTGHNYRVGAQARYLALKIGCDPLTAYQIYVAGLLYETGKLALPQQILAQPYDQLSPHQQTSLNHFFEQSVTMLSKISQLVDVVKIIKHTAQPFNNLTELNNSDEAVPLGSKILAVVIAFDNLVLGRQTKAHISVKRAKQLIEAQGNKTLDQTVVELFLNMMAVLPATDDEFLEFAADLTGLGTDWVLTKDLENSKHGILLTQGTVLKQGYIDKLSKVANEQEQPLLLFIRKPITVVESDIA